jgi:hypothetical protein
MASWDIDNTLSALNLLAGMADDYQKNKLAYEMQVQKTELDEQKFERTLENDEYTKNLGIIKMFQDSAVPGLPADKYKQTGDALMTWADKLPEGDIKTAANGVYMGIQNSGEKATAIADFDLEMIEAQQTMQGYQEEFKSNNYSNVNALDQVITDLKESLINTAHFTSASQKQMMQKMIKQFEGESSVREIMAGFDMDGNLTKFDIDEAKLNAQTYTNPYTGEKVKSGMEYFRMAETFANAGEWEKSLAMLERAPGKQNSLVDKTKREVDKQVTKQASDFKSLVSKSKSAASGGTYSDNYRRWKNIGIIASIKAGDHKMFTEDDLNEMQHSKFYLQNYPNNGAGLRMFIEDRGMADQFKKEDFDSYTDKQVEVEKTEASSRRATEVGERHAQASDALELAFGKDSKSNLKDIGALGDVVTQFQVQGTDRRQINYDLLNEGLRDATSRFTSIIQKGTELEGGEMVGGGIKQLFGGGTTAITDVEYSTLVDTQETPLNKSKVMFRLLNRMDASDKVRREILSQIRGNTDFQSKDVTLQPMTNAMQKLSAYHDHLFAQSILFNESGKRVSDDQLKVRVEDIFKDHYADMKNTGINMDAEWKKTKGQEFAERLKRLGFPLDMIEEIQNRSNSQYGTFR